MPLNSTTLRAACLLALCLAATGIVRAQTYKYIPAGTATSGNYVFGSTNARHNQTLLPPGSFSPNPTGAVTVGRLYFRIGTVGVTTRLDSIRISIAQTRQNEFDAPDDTSRTFVTGLKEVFFRPSHTLPAGTTLGAWFAFNLDSTFLYDPTMSLVVDIKFKSTTAAFSVRSLSVPGNLVRAASNNLVDSVGKIITNLIPHIGIDIPTAVEGGLDKPQILAGPNPDRGKVTWFVPAKLMGEPFSLTDATGRVMRTGIQKEEMEVTGLRPGLYHVVVRGQSLRFMVE